MPGLAYPAMYDVLLMVLVVGVVSVAFIVDVVAVVGWIVRR